MGRVQGAVPSMEEGRQQNAGYLNASAAAERLQRNVNREHFLCTDFLLAFWQARRPCSPTGTLESCPGLTCNTDQKLLTAA